jgi:purine-binding chemotaxis protein CheW
MNAELSQGIVFKIAEEEYSVDISQVKSIEQIQEITAIPQTSPSMLGVINIRGSILPLFDFRKLLGKDTKESDDLTRIILVDSKEKTIGIVVDEANEVMEIPSDTIQYPSFTKNENAFVRGISLLGDRLIILLDIDKLLLHNDVKDDMEQLQTFIEQNKE